VVYSGLRSDIIFDGQFASPQRINLLCIEAHYHAITNLAASMAKRYVCPACNIGCGSGVLHKCDASCDACSSIPPSIPDITRIPCDECNRHQKFLKISGKTLCEVKRRCRQCGAMKVENHKCNKQFCSQCLKER